MNPISREVAAHVLFHFCGEGFPPGSFIEALLLAFARADSMNTIKLGKGFPDYYLAMRLAKEDVNGIEKLSAIFNGETYDD